ncbi:MAG: hypothetical protein AB7N76_08495 [Planctomycetota bacterium]
MSEPCPACGASSSRARLHEHERLIRACRSCGHGWLSPVPAPEELKALYGLEQDANLEDGHALEPGPSSRTVSRTSSTR